MPDTTPTSPASAPAPTAAGECDPPNLPSIDPSFLETPPDLGERELVAQVLVADEEGIADLGRTDIRVAFEISGAIPVLDRDWRVVALEAGSPGECAVRILLDDDFHEQRRLAPLFLELDVNGTTYFPSEVGDCTALAQGGDAFVGIECMGMAASAPVSAARVWMRLAWGQIAVQSTLPGWGLAFLGPEPTDPPAGAAAFQRLLSDAFSVPDPPPIDDATLAAQSVAAGPDGWVVVGRFDPLQAGDELSPADAAVWTSADARDWLRLDDPEVFGGPGYQGAYEVIADDDGWWILGNEVTGSEAAGFSMQPLVWHSADGREWTRSAVACGEAPDCPKFQVTGMGSLPGDGVLVVGFRPASAIVANMTADGSLSMEQDLPDAASIPEGSVPIAFDIVTAAGQYVALGRWLVQDVGEERIAIWRSGDGVDWALVDAVNPGSFQRLAATRMGWFGLGFGTVSRSEDLVHWTSVLASENVYFRDLLEIDGTLIVVGDGEVPVAYTSSDGLEWQAVTIEAGTRPDPWSVQTRALATGGTDVILVGGFESNAGFWRWDRP